MRLLNLVVTVQDILDFARLDPIGTNFSLPVGTSYELEVSIRPQTDKVPRAVHATTGLRVRIRRELGCRELGIAEIASSHTRSTNVEFTFAAGSARVAAGIHNRPGYTR
jgi:hypothetical protein